MIELGRRLGRTAAEVGLSMSAAELTRQRAYDQVIAAEQRAAHEKANQKR